MKIPVYILNQVDDGKKAIQWEIDFLKELMPSLYFNHIRIYDSYTNIIGKFKNCGKNIIVFSSNNLYFSLIKNIITELKPFIAFHLSDEWGNEPEYQQLSSIVPVIFRQHHHGHYNHPNNIYYIPLGYRSGFMDKKIKDIPKIKDRRYIWSFVGNMLKKDRPDIFQNFKHIVPYFIYDTSVRDEMHPSAMREIYSQSIFAPAGRGNIRLDCFRIYEACVSGAIPIVVGPEVEISETFKHEENPPWIFASTWEEATSVCDSLIKEKDKLKYMQEEILLWWNKRIQKIKNFILKVLEVSQINK